MVRSLLLFFTMLLSIGTTLAQTVLSGEVSDAVEPLIGASIKVLKGGEFFRGGVTDVNGRYRISLDPGKYDVEVSYTGYSVQRQTGVQVLAGQLNKLDIRMEATASGNLLGEVVIKEFKVPLIKQDQTSGGQTLTSDQIKNLPTRSVNAIVATTAGTSSVDGGAVTIKGSRSNATNYYIDGIRVTGSMPPVQDIEQLQIVTGGLGAEYGDVTGGVISILTKGPASDFSGAVEIENSRGLDPYGWLLATANISGPIIKVKSADGKSKRTLVGFRLSGQYNTQRDDDAPATSIYRAKGDFLGADQPFGSQFTEGSPLDNIQQHPLKRVRGVVTSAAEAFTNDSVDVLKYRPFEGRRDIDVTAKLDFRLTDNMDLSVTGTYKDVKNQFTPGDWGDAHWLLLNSHNNPTAYDNRYRGLARFRHRLGNTDKEQLSKSTFGVANASYQIQFGYERGLSRREDPRHKDRLFDYGYVGQFEFTTMPAVGLVNNALRHVGYFDTFEGFTPGTQNPGLVAYNEFANTELFDSYLARNGRFSSLYTNIWSGMHANINNIYNRNSKNQADVMTISASSNFDLKLGKSGVHNIQFGLINEQRTERDWVLNPFGLWELARKLQNGHINGLDTTKIIGTIPTDLGIDIPEFGYKLTTPSDASFYKKVREANGLTLDDWVNIQGFTPDQLSLDMFSPFELTNEQLINYYGYDYLGNPLPSGVTFNDFFTSRGADGVRDFPVAALRPLYQAAYFKDKFTFNKMIFSLGMRVERFDLNTKVMRDKYSLYEVKSADQFYADAGNSVPARPANVGDDYKVYITSRQDYTPKAFRLNDTWFDANGTQVNDPALIFGGGVVVPDLRDSIAGGNIRDERFDPNTAFADYTPQINWLPRLAFSFPISDDANFFAHYDVLVQRPPDSWQVTPLNYYYFYDAGRTTTNNANLLPERVVDYEVGFQQKLNQNSALKFSAYYREMRDMIQERTIPFVPTLGRYSTAGNVDFGTVKGFTVQYDLRRIKNLELQMAYTLQFADGTGSNAASQRGQRTPLRTLFPLDFDERHSINGILDYRFDEGGKYNGPTIFGKDILALFGANMQFGAVSGRPYTSKVRAVRFGGDGTVGAINGNRLPWRLNIDLRLDKTVHLSKSPARPLDVNIYFRVANLLDRRNLTSVYSYTGSPTDDGYLATAEGQSIQQGVVNQGRDLAAYRASYSWALLNPNNFTLPRRLYVGLSFGF